MTRVRRALTCGVVWSVLTGCSVHAPFTPDRTAAPAVVELTPDRDWEDTGLSVSKGERLFVTTAGSIFWGFRGLQADADGVGGYPGWKVGPGGLVGRVGERTFDIGARTQPFLSKYLRVHSYSAPPAIVMPSDGRLMLGFKDFQANANTGDFQVTIWRAR